jgi:hypothetical protein
MPFAGFFDSFNSSAADGGDRGAHDWPYRACAAPIETTREGQRARIARTHLTPESGHVPPSRQNKGWFRGNAVDFARLVMTSGRNNGVLGRESGGVVLRVGRCTSGAGCMKTTGCVRAPCPGDGISLMGHPHSNWRNWGPPRRRDFARATVSRAPPIDLAALFRPPRDPPAGKRCRFRSCFR